MELCLGKSQEAIKKINENVMGCRQVISVMQARKNKKMQELKKGLFYIYLYIYFIFIYIFLLLQY